VAKRKKTAAPIVEKRIVRRPEVLRATGLSDSGLDKLVDRGEFPHPFPLTSSGKAVGWLLSDIDAWIDERVAASRADPSGSSGVMTQKAATAKPAPATKAAVAKRSRRRADAEA